MKKFVALVVLSCAVMFSSTAAAEDFSSANGKILCMTYDELFHEAERELAVEKHMRLSVP